jgi:hypothetical protein
MWVVVESVHAVTYFAPSCRQVLRDAGLRGFWAGYFAARAAPLGAVGAGHGAPGRAALLGRRRSVVPDGDPCRRGRAGAAPALPPRPAGGALGIPAGVLRDNRGWTEPQWNGGIAALVGRGLLDADGMATDEGHELRGRIEAMTDDLAASAFTGLSDDELAALHGALLACATEVHGSGLLPFPNPIGLPVLE